MKLELVIFDCDGVLIDSEPIANRVLCRQLARAGLVLPEEEIMRRFVGRTRAGCLRSPPSCSAATCLRGSAKPGMPRSSPPSKT